MRALRLKPKVELFSWEGLSWLILAAGLMAILGAQKAHAGPPVALPNGTVLNNGMPAWTNTAKYDDCGQNCIVDHANENLTMQAIYVIQKSQNLEDIYNNGMNNGGDSDPAFKTVIQSLGPYCPEVSSDSDKQADAQKCLSTYLGAQAEALRKIKTSMVQNEDTTSRLKSQVSVFGTGSATQGHASAFQDGTQGVRNAQEPQFLSEKALMSSGAAANGEKDLLKESATEDYAAWENQNFRAPPSKFDYVQTIQVVDPNNPNSAPITQIVRNKDGTPKLDPVKFKAAQDQYNQDMGLEQSVTPYLADKTHQAVKLGQVDPMLPNPKAAPSADPLSSLSYKQARALAVESENKLSSGVLGTVNYAAPKKSTAGATPQKPAPSNPKAPDGVTGSGWSDLAKEDAGYEEPADPTLQNNKAGNVHVHSTVSLDPKQIDDQIAGMEGFFANTPQPAATQAAASSSGPKPASQPTSAAKPQQPSGSSSAN